MLTSITAAGADSEAAIRRYLDDHIETSMFLASNLARHGSALTEALNSGQFKCLLDDDALVGVFCLTRRGNLLAETGGRTEFAPLIVDACRDEPIPIRGVVGEWRLADAIWSVLLRTGLVIEATHVSREPLYRLDLTTAPAPRRSPDVRLLRPADFDEWLPLNDAYLREEGLPIQGDVAQRRQGFAESAASGHWWGRRADRGLVALAALNAVHESVGQVGGVYTVPAERRRGHARALMATLMRDCRERLGIGKLLLFTGERNPAAQRLYESLGFERAGDFALLFGEPADPG